VIGGYISDNPLDALSVGYYEGDKLMFASNVRNGFVPRLRRLVWSKLKALETEMCRLANLPEKKRTQWALAREEMKDCVWPKPELLGRSSSRSGHLMVIFRHSKFCGLRKDKEPHGVFRD
jgi:ATP-dependent DNA ligase